MDRARLISALSSGIPANLSADLVDAFLTIRADAATRTLGRAAPGKFVETVVQILQHLATGAHDAQPSVDEFLKSKAENLVGLDDGLRIVAARVARATYTLRNKRNIAHKTNIDPSVYDLAFLHAAARWVITELLRQSQGLTMDEAGALIDMVHAPVGRLVEEIDGRRIVHGDLTISDELLVLLHSHYPDHVPTKAITESLDRRSAGAVRNKLRELYDDKLVQGDGKKGYRLTTVGFDRAAAIIAEMIS